MSELSITGNIHLCNKRKGRLLPKQLSTAIRSAIVSGALPLPPSIRVITTVPPLQSIQQFTRALLSVIPQSKIHLSTLEHYSTKPLSWISTSIDGAPKSFVFSDNGDCNDKTSRTNNSSSSSKNIISNKNETNGVVEQREKKMEAVNEHLLLRDDNDISMTYPQNSDTDGHLHYNNEARDHTNGLSATNLEDEAGTRYSTDTWLSSSQDSLLAEPIFLEDNTDTTLNGHNDSQQQQEQPLYLRNVCEHTTLPTDVDSSNSQTVRRSTSRKVFFADADHCHNNKSELSSDSTAPTTTVAAQHDSTYNKNDKDNRYFDWSTLERGAIDEVDEKNVTEANETHEIRPVKNNIFGSIQEAQDHSTPLLEALSSCFSTEQDEEPPSDILILRQEIKTLSSRYTPALFRSVTLNSILKSVSVGRQWPRDFLKEIWKVFDIAGLSYYCRPKRATSGLRLVASGWTQSHCSSRTAMGRDCFFLNLLPTEQSVGIADGGAEVVALGLDPLSLPHECMTLCYGGSCVGLMHLDSTGRNRAHSLALWVGVRAERYGSTSLCIACMDPDGSGLEFSSLGNCTLAVLNRTDITGKFQVTFKTTEVMSASKAPCRFMKWPSPPEIVWLSQSDIQADRILAEASKGFLTSTSACSVPLTDSETGRIPVREGSLVLLGSDGFWNSLSEGEILELVSLAIAPCEATVSGDIRLATTSRDLCMCLVKAAYIRSRNATKSSCSRKKSEDGGNYNNSTNNHTNHSGNIDDITLIVGWITTDDVPFSQ